MNRVQAVKGPHLECQLDDIHHGGVAWRYPRPWEHSMPAVPSCPTDVLARAREVAGLLFDESQTGTLGYFLFVGRKPASSAASR